MATKRCMYCGETKDEEEFRKYYNRPNGRYKYCSSCERIEARRKYLCRKSELSKDEQGELQMINQLYEARLQAGLQAPGQTRAKIPVIDKVRMELEELK